MFVEWDVLHRGVPRGLRPYDSLGVRDMSYFCSFAESNGNDLMLCVCTLSSRCWALFFLCHLNLTSVPYLSISNIAGDSSCLAINQASNVTMSASDENCLSPPVDMVVFISTSDKCSLLIQRPRADEKSSFESVVQAQEGQERGTLHWWVNLSLVSVYACWWDLTQERC